MLGDRGTGKSTAVRALAALLPKMPVMRGSRYNLLPDDDSFCASDYGISPSQIQANIDKTNKYYGAGRPDLAQNASRILYVNGNVDPWSGLSILTSPSQGLPVLEVEGASHHAWTHPSTPSDQATVVAARKLIRAQVSKWLAEE